MLLEIPPTAILLTWWFWVGAFYPSFLDGTRFILLVGVIYWPLGNPVGVLSSF
jgi:hypothetical protein